MKTDNDGTIWTSHTTYVDAETGEIIHALDARTKYIIIKTYKHVTTNFNKTKRHIEYTRECRKQPQQELPFNNK